MAKIQVNLKLSVEVANLLQEIAEKEGKTKAFIVEQAILSYVENKKTNTDNAQIQLLEHQNQQLSLAIQSLSKILDEKEKSIEKIENTYERLLKEKDERIKELQERLKEKSKPFWKLW